jgi:diguanylate cyclase (GGDEF)-like protein/PAS domain S-box-containing protein
MKRAKIERGDRAQVTLESIGEAVISTDVEGKVTFLNPVAERLTGWRVGEARGQPIDAVFNILDATTREGRTRSMVSLATEPHRPGHLPGCCILIRRDAEEIYIEDSTAPIHGRDGKATGSVIVFRDVSEARRVAEEMMHASQHDFLTGLPNRLLMEDRLGQAIALAERHSGEVAVLYLDLDQFKQVNDSLGHMAGDKLLQSVAERLQEQVRLPDTVSRQGGDEFVVLLQEVKGRADVELVLKRILEAVAEVHSIGEHQVSVSASVGVSRYPEDGMDAETLVKHADTALYQAKASGLGSFKFFKAAMNARAVYRRKLAEDLRWALGNDEFELHYQPTIDLKSGAISGVEALLRWTSAKRGAMAPETFLEVAEETGLMLPIGGWVLREACRQAKSWLEEGLPAVSMAVNVSAMHLQDARFRSEVKKVLEETGLSPATLELEVAETVLTQLPDRSRAAVQSLRQMGVKVSIDDFGAGYSSLSHLKKLPVDILKIDRSFLHPLKEQLDDASIAVAIIRMGKSLKLRVVAEGVESLEDMKFLQAQECDEAQGFFFSAPVPADEFAAMLRKRQFSWKMKSGGPRAAEATRKIG